MRPFLLIFVLAVTPLAAEEWSRFRGANAAGTAVDGPYPAKLDPQSNAVWRVPVRPGKSSPILTRDRVFLTAAENGLLYTQCFDRATGRLLWERSVPKTHDLPANRLNHPAAITPVTDGTHVYSFFKDFGLVAYDHSGKELWRAPLGPFTTTMGLGASPVLSGGNVVVVADQVEGSFIAAVDRGNGELRWKQEREEGEGWGTPLVHAGHVLTVSRGQYGVYSAQGKRVSTLRGLPTTIVGSPLIVDGVLYVQGYGAEAPAPFSQRLEKLDKNKDGKLSRDEYLDEPFLSGIARYVGNRDLVITEDEWNLKQKEVLGPNCLVAYRLELDKDGLPQARELWRFDRSFTGVIPTPLVYRGIVYFVKNGGILTALDAADGRVRTAGRVPGALGGYSSSPVAADGKIFLASEDGNLAVVRAGADWEVLSVVNGGEAVYATPALSSGDVFLRTESALYRFRDSNK
jgi:outer membrane protein assembly factor BamB